MNSLLNYGSDDDCDGSSEEKQTDSYYSSRNYRKPGLPRQDDANYDEVQMSLSEGSSDESKPVKDSSSSRDREEHYRDYDDRSSPKSKDDYRSFRKDRRDDRYPGKSDRDDRYASKSDRDDRYTSKSDRDEDRRDDRYPSKSDRDDRYPGKSDRDDKYASKSDRDEDRRDDRYASKSDRDDDRYPSKSDREEDRSRHRDDDRDRRDDRRGKGRDWYGRDDRNRERKDRDRRRSRSPRERRRSSRSPRRTERSRSKSKDRGSRPAYSKRFDRTNTKMERLDKMGIEIKTPDCQYVTPADLQKSMGEEKAESKDRFFVPGITGRFRDQIEKRKLLWQKREPETRQQQAIPVAVPSSSRTTKVWEATTFAQDTDGKVANKFKRLMGIRSVAEGSNSASEVLKKQEEMFSSMEQQYEVARTATHTMRGVGLGFSSYQR